MALNNHIIGALDHHAVDDRGLGRWTYSVINTRKKKKLVIMTAYRLTNEQLLGNDTIYAQQYRILRRQKIHQPKPRKIFDTDLCTLLREWHRQKHEIILMIDANASINDNNLQRIMNSADLYDLMCAKHGLTSPNTFVRGTKTIDFILGTKGVLDAIEYCGIRQFNADIISDHRALWIDLNITKLLHKKLSPLYTRQPQMTSKNKRWSQYARKHTSAILRNLHVQSNIRSLYEKLATNAPRTELIAMLEQIDTDIQSAMLKGVSPTKQHSAWWSPQLHHAFLMKQYWLLKRKERITNISMTIPLNLILDQIPPNSPLHHIKNSKNIRRHLRNAQKFLMILVLMHANRGIYFLNKKCFNIGSWIKTIQHRNCKQ